MATTDPQLKLIFEGLDLAVTRVVRGITLECTSELKDGTPVLTGWARANWTPQIGSPYVVDLEGVDPTKNPGAVQGASAQAEAGVAQVATSYIFNINAPRAIYISNNVPYIGRLNDGWSKKAPAGFIQQRIEKGVAQGARRLS